jgi:hypothetical protein
MRQLRRTTLIGPVIFAFAAVIALSWSAVARGAATEVFIQMATADRGAGTLTLLGTGFDTKQDTIVSLGGTQLTILTETSTEIVAAIAGDIPAGVYLL